VEKRSGAAVQLTSYNAANHTSSPITNLREFLGHRGSRRKGLCKESIGTIDFSGTPTNTPDAVDLFDFLNPNRHC